MSLRLVWKWLKEGKQQFWTTEAGMEVRARVDVKEGEGKEDGVVFVTEKDEIILLLMIVLLLMLLVVVGLAMVMMVEQWIKVVEDMD